MNRATGATSIAAIKLVIAAPPLVDVVDLLEGLSRQWPGSSLRDYKLGMLDAIRLELPASSTESQSLVNLYVLLGNEQYNALQEVLLSNADGILLVTDMESSQRNTSIETVLQTTQSLRRQGRDSRQVPIVLLYFRCEKTSPEIIAQWDQLLEWERNQLARYCASSRDHSTVAQAVQALLQRVREKQNG